MTGRATTRDRAPMTGRTVLVTGATTGIGRAIATALADLGATVGVVGRDPARTELAAHQIAASTAATVVPFAADLSAQAQVRALAAQVADTWPRLDVLVNNVGGFLLTNLLAAPLSAADAARVVTVSSGAQAMARIDLADLGGLNHWSGQRAYNQSKLANVLFTYELARRWAHTPVTANVGRPGVVRTGFGHEDPTPAMRRTTRLVTPFMQTPERGAATFVHLACSPDLAGITGTYFANSRPHRSSRASYDTDLATRLWQASANLVGLPVQSAP